MTTKKPQNKKEPPSADKIFDIDREIFKKNDARTGDLHLQLLEKYMVYKDLADRCIINPAHSGKFNLKRYNIFR
jgi:hypothetical protein